MDRLAYRLDQQRLRQARHALQQNVPVGQQPHKGPFDEPVLADDRLPNLGHKIVDERGFLLHHLVYLTYARKVHHG